jgi:hypothetical protein
MPAQSRAFQTVDPFGRMWTAEFRWLQNAISIRHADAVDLKYYLTGEDGQREIVLALPNPALAAVAAKQGRAVTDAWCLGLGSLRLKEMIASWDDMEKTVVTVPAADLERLAAALLAREEAGRERAALHH